MTNKLLQGEELCKYLDQIEAEGMAVTKQWHTLWQTAVMYAWGEQLQGIKRNPDWDYVAVNYIYPLMMQSIAKLSKNNPKILGRPWNDKNAEYAERWQGIIQYIWEQQLNMREDLIYALLVASIFGYVVGKVCWRHKVEWDEKQKRWVGDVHHYLVHPANFWADVSATRIRDARCLGSIRKVRLDWALSQWPEHAKAIKREARKATDSSETQYNDGFSVLSSGVPVYERQPARSLKQIVSGFVSLIMGKDTNESHEAAGEKQTEYVWLHETYFRDDYEKHIKIEDYIPTQQLIESGRYVVEDGTGIIKSAADGKPLDRDIHPKQVIEEYDKPLFPRGRFIIRIGKTILNPELENQTYKYKRWPFSVMPHHILPFMWQGSNAIEASRGSQDLLNVTIAHLIQHVKLNADPIKIIEAQTLAKDKRGKVRVIKGKAGEIVVVKKGRKDGIRNLESGRLGPEVYTLAEFLKRDIETQQFMHETAQGVSTKGKITATEAARLDTNAHDMIALRSVLLDKFIESTASNIAELVQDRYEPERRLRIIGTDGQTRNLVMDMELKRVEWDLEIEPGSTLPFDEERRKNDYATAYKLLGEPVVNPMLEDMLRVLNIANRSKILARHKQTQLFRQFIMLAQQVQGAIQQAQQAGEPISPETLIAAKEQLMQQVLQLMQQVNQVIQGAA